MQKILENLKKLKDVYSEVKEFQFGKELTLKLRLLNSEEESEIHAQAMNFDQGLAYLYAVKRETINRSIIGLNGNDLPDAIEDVSEEGIPQKIQRHAWLKKHITRGWNQSLIDDIWKKGYATLVSSLDEKLGNIEVEPVKTKEK